jgi:hypothetical protein
MLRDCSLSLDTHHLVKARQDMFRQDVRKVKTSLVLMHINLSVANKMLEDGVIVAGTLMIWDWQHKPDTNKRGYCVLELSCDREVL